jgi:hypothetical protein
MAYSLVDEGRTEVVTISLVMDDYDKVACASPAFGGLRSDLVDTVVGCSSAATTFAPPRVPSAAGPLQSCGFSTDG